MPRRQLFAAILGLGLIPGILQLWNPFRVGDRDPSEGPIHGPIAIEPSEHRWDNTHMASTDGVTGASTHLGRSDAGDTNGHPEADAGISLAAMAEALRSAPDAGRKAEWADRIAATGGREAVEHLVALADREQDEESLRSILEAFKGLSDPQDILLLASAVTATSDFRILEAATEMISRSATSEVVDYLAELSRLDPLQPTQRFAALWAVERIQNPEARRALAKVAQGASEPDLARAAAVALARLGGPLAESVLTESAMGRHHDNPDFHELLRNVATGRASGTDPAETLASWSPVPEDGNP